MFPGLSLMRSFSIRKIEVATAPDPKACLIQMINIQLKVTLYKIVSKNGINKYNYT